VRATPDFTVDAYEPSSFDEQAQVPEGFQLSRTRIVKTFSGQGEVAIDTEGAHTFTLDYDLPGEV
jgi:hypothetical protein